MDRLTYFDCGKWRLKIGDMEYSGEIADKLAHYEDLAEQGRLVELPCKIGDYLWTYSGSPELHFFKTLVTDISYLNGDITLNTDRMGVVANHEIGKTVFLTREEAEAKLAEKGGVSDETD